MALSFVFLDENKTLTDKEIDLIYAKLSASYEKHVQAEIENNKRGSIGTDQADITNPGTPEAARYLLKKRTGETTKSRIATLREQQQTNEEKILPLKHWNKPYPKSCCRKMNPLIKAFEQAIGRYIREIDKCIAS